MVAVSLFFAIAAIYPSVFASTLYMTFSAVCRIIFGVREFFIALVHRTIAVAVASRMPCYTAHDAQATDDKRGKQHSLTPSLVVQDNVSNGG